MIPHESFLSQTPSSCCLVWCVVLSQPRLPAMTSLAIMSYPGGTEHLNVTLVPQSPLLLGISSRRAVGASNGLFSSAIRARFLEIETSDRPKPVSYSLEARGELDRGPTENDAAALRLEASRVGAAQLRHFIGSANPLIPAITLAIAASGAPLLSLRRQGGLCLEASVGRDQPSWNSALQNLLSSRLAGPTEGKLCSITCPSSSALLTD